MAVSDGSGLLTPYSEVTLGNVKSYSLGLRWKRNSRHSLYSEVTMGGDSRNYQLGMDWKPNSPLSLHLVGERKAYGSGINKHKALLEARIRF